MRAIVCAMVVTAAIGGAAAAQPIATDPAPAPSELPAQAQPPAPGAIVGVVGGGVAGASDIGDAWVGRFEVVAFPVFRRKDQAGAIVGFGYGFEYWRAGADNWGLALPAGLQVGAKVGPARGTVGFGIHALVVDQVDDDTGVGTWSPYANAQLGFQWGMVTVVIDGRIDHRFLYGADDRTQWSLGLMVGITDENAFKKRKRNRGPW